MITQFNKKIRKAINFAIENAKTNKHKFKLCSVCLDKHYDIISYGVNSLKSHTKQASLASKKGHPSQIGLHSELAALLKAGRKKTPYLLIVIRLLQNGSLAMAKPCKMCREAINLVDVKKLIYSTNNGFVLEKIKNEKEK